MKMKLVAGLAFLLNTILFATYYSVAKEALGRIDPIIFSYFEMMSLSPVAICIILFSWKDMSRAVFKRGVLLGSCLCLALFTISIALKYTSATSTAFFPSLNGFLAALIAWLFLRQPVRGPTWFAGILSGVGTILLVMNSSQGAWRGSLIAFLGGVFFTCYIFLSDQQQKDETAHWPLFGIELLTMAVWANLVALLFGDWQAVHPTFPKDALVVLYVAGACTFLPTLIAVLMQKHISPLTVSFIYILEPVLGAVMANFYLHETLPLLGYAGGALVVVGAVVHTWGTARQPSEERSMPRLFRAARRVHRSWIASFGYCMLCFSAGLFLLYELGGVPPRSWRDLYQLWPTIPQLIQQGQRTFVVLLGVQALSWLIAWASLIIIGLLTVYQLIHIRRGAPAGFPLPASRAGSSPNFLATRVYSYGSEEVAYEGAMESMLQDMISHAPTLELRVQGVTEGLINHSPPLEVRVHQQEATLPCVVTRKGEKVLRQQRRRDRLQRLG